MATASLLKWVETFGVHCGDLAELADGASLFQLLTELAPEHTVGVALASGGAAAADGNMKKCMAVLSAWLEETFAIKPDLHTVFSVAKLTAGTVPDIQRLLEIVLVAAVHSSKKDAIVNKILSMGEADQTHLMSIIEETVGNIAALTGSTDVAADASASHDAKDAPAAGAAAAGAGGAGSPALRGAAGVGDFDADSSRLSIGTDFGDDKQSQSAQIRQLKLENAKVHDLLDDATRQTRELKKRVEQLRTELEESQRASKQGLDATLAAATTAADEKLKAEQTRAARAATQHDMIVTELKREHSALNSQYEKFKRKAADDADTAKRDAQQMRDELDLLKEKAKKLIAAETQLERYKKKLEAAGEVRTALTDAEQQRNNDLERIMTLEAEAKRIPALQAQVNKYKEEIIDLNGKLTDLTASDEHNKGEADRWRSEAQNAKKEHKMVADALEQTKAELAKSVAEDATPVKSALSDQLVSDLKQRVLRLELENKELKAAPGSGANSDLTDKLEMAQRLHTTTQAKYLDAQKTIRQLTDQLESAKSAAAAVTSSAAVGGSADAAALAAAKQAAATAQAAGSAAQAQLASLNKEIDSLRAQLAAKPAPAAAVDVAGAAGAAGAGGAASGSTVILGAPSTNSAGAGAGAVLISQLEKAEAYGRQMKAAYDKEHALTTAATMKLKASERQRLMFAEAVNKLKAHVAERERELKEREKIRLEEKQATKLEQRLLASAFYEIGFDFHSALLSGRAARKPGAGAGGALGGNAAAASSHMPGAGASTSAVAVGAQPSSTKSFLAKQRNKVANG